jgi:hypothetical protein
MKPILLTVAALVGVGTVGTVIATGGTTPQKNFDAEINRYAKTMLE